MLLPVVSDQVFPKTPPPHIILSDTFQSLHYIYTYIKYKPHFSLVLQVANKEEDSLSRK